MIVLDNAPTKIEGLSLPKTPAVTCLNDVLRALPRGNEFAPDALVMERQIRDAAEMIDTAIAHCRGETSVSERARKAREILCQLLPGRVYIHGDSLYQSEVTFNWYVIEGLGCRSAQADNYDTTGRRHAGCRLPASFDPRMLLKLPFS